MSGWLGFVVLVGAVLVAIAPRRVLGPVFGWIRRLVGSGVLAVLALSAGGYLLLRGDLGQPAQGIALASVATGIVFALWWIYRRFVPRYREQAREPDELA